jgi:hypothetical protein
MVRNRLHVYVLALIAIVGLLFTSPAEAQTNPAKVEVTPDGGVNVFTNYRGKQLRSFAITPAGSLIAGGVSMRGTRATDEPPTVDPALYDRTHDDERNWIHDFYFGRYEHNGGQPRLHTRGLIMWGRGDSPDVQMGRTGPDNAPTTYGSPQDTEPHSCLGKMIFTAWGEGQFQGDIAGIYARNDTVPTGKRNPGSLHLGTAGESQGTPKEQERGWRDAVDRLVISSRGFVAIGDGFANAAERLHVDGNILANGDLIAKRDIQALGVIKSEVRGTTGHGKKVDHAALVGPEAALYFRGEGQLVDGKADIKLPEYFEQLAQKEGRTVLLTNIDGFDRIAVKTKAGAAIADGMFKVISANPHSTQKFFWEVKARRADVGAL